MGTTTPAPTRPRRARVGKWWTLAATLLVLGLLAAAGWSSWRSHPNAFFGVYGDYGNGGRYKLSQGPFRSEIAQPLVESGTVRIDEAEPVVVTNTADARITFSVCTTKPGAGISFGGAMRNMTRYCSDVVPLEEGFTLPLGQNAGYQVTMNIDPAHAGTVQVRGVRLTYQHGNQYGTQVVGKAVSVRFTDTSGGEG